MTKRKLNEKFLNFGIPEDLDQKISEEALDLGLSKADFIRQQLSVYFNNKEAEPVS